MSDNGKPAYEVVWPLGKTAPESFNIAPPVTDLNGKTVGEVWDWLFRGSEMFPLLRERLRERFPDVRFVDYSNFANIHYLGASHEGMVEALREEGCDVLISGIGA